VLRRTILIGAGVITLLIGAVSAGGRSSGDPYAGAWSVANIPGFDQNTPWKSGGTLTVKTATESQVEAYKNVPGPGGSSSALEGECLHSGEPSGPIVSAWYLASYSWGGQQGTMGGCISNRTGAYPNFWGQGTAGQLQTGATACSPSPCLRGYWTDRPGPYLTFAAGPEGTTETVSEPAPGKTTTIDSPELPTGASCRASPARALSASKPLVCSVDLTSSSGDLKGTDVLAEGETVKEQAGTLAVACWFLFDFRDEDGDILELTPGQRLRNCFAFARAYYRAHKLGGGPVVRAKKRASTGARRETASGCRTARIVVALKTRKGRVVSVKRAKSQKMTASSVRYSCSASGGDAKITLTGPKKGTLRKALGKKLDLQVIRSKKASRRSAKLTFTFGW
jgi:hypothetical protein